MVWTEQKQKILRRGGKKTQKTIQNSLMTRWPQWCNHSPRARHLEVQSQVGLRKHHNKQSGDDGIPVELFQILKYDAVKVLNSVCQKIWKIHHGHGTWKGQFSFQPKERQCQRISNYRTIALISHASKVMHKILQVRLQLYMNQELSDTQAGFRKGGGTRDQLPTSTGS